MTTPFTQPLGLPPPYFYPFTQYHTFFPWLLNFIYSTSKSAGYFLTSLFKRNIQQELYFFWQQWKLYYKQETCLLSFYQLTAHLVNKLLRRPTIKKYRQYALGWKDVPPSILCYTVYFIWPGKHFRLAFATNHRIWWSQLQPMKVYEIYIRQFYDLPK